MLALALWLPGCDVVNVRADLEVLLKKHPSRILKLADKDNLTTLRSRVNDNDNPRFSLDFMNVVKMSEDQPTSAEHGLQPEALIC